MRRVVSVLVAGVIIAGCGSSGSDGTTSTAAATRSGHRARPGHAHRHRAHHGTARHPKRDAAKPKPKPKPQRPRLGPLPDGDQAQLASIALKPAQLGTGIVSKPYQDGTEVAGQVTLDLCDQHFASEALRRTRLQIAYLHRSDPEYGVSNEVVGYEPGGINEAMSELRRVAANCPAGVQPAAVGNEPPASFTVHRLRLKGLRPGALAVRIHETLTANGKRESGNSYFVYQTRGSVLSAVYVNADSDSVAMRIVAKAAALAARNLDAA